jgi:hypothetical protein
MNSSGLFDAEFVVVMLIPCRDDDDDNYAADDYDGDNPSD